METEPRASDAMAFPTVDSSSTCARYATETTPRVWDVMVSPTVDWSLMRAAFATALESRKEAVIAMETPWTVPASAVAEPQWTAAVFVGGMGFQQETVIVTEM